MGLRVLRPRQHLCAHQKEIVPKHSLFALRKRQQQIETMRDFTLTISYGDTGIANTVIRLNVTDDDGDGSPPPPPPPSRGGPTAHLALASAPNTALTTITLTEGGAAAGGYVVKFSKAVKLSSVRLVLTGGNARQPIEFGNGIVGLAPATRFVRASKGDSSKAFFIRAPQETATNSDNERFTLTISYGDTGIANTVITLNVTDDDDDGSPPPPPPPSRGGPTAHLALASAPNTALTTITLTEGGAAAGGYVVKFSKAVKLSSVRLVLTGGNARQKIEFGNGVPSLAPATTFTRASKGDSSKAFFIRAPQETATNRDNERFTLTISYGDTGIANTVIRLNVTDDDGDGSPSSPPPPSGGGPTAHLALASAPDTALTTITLTEGGAASAGYVVKFSKAVKLSSVRLALTGGNARQPIEFGNGVPSLAVATTFTRASKGDSSKAFFIRAPQEARTNTDNERFTLTISYGDSGIANTVVTLKITDDDGAGAGAQMTLTIPAGAEGDTITPTVAFSKALKTDAELFSYGIASDPASAIVKTASGASATRALTGCDACVDEEGVAIATTVTAGTATNFGGCDSQKRRVARI